MLNNLEGTPSMSPQKPSAPNDSPKDDLGVVNIRLSTGTLGKVLIPVIAAALGAFGGFASQQNPSGSSTPQSGELQPNHQSGPKTAADRAWCDEIVARATWHARIDAANKVCSQIPSDEIRRVIYECAMGPKTNGPIKP